MHIIICLDDRNGMTFNKRRQSRDSAVSARIAERIKSENAVLRMSTYSEKIFPEGCAIISDDYLDIAGSGEYCFTEREDISLYKEKIESIIVYKWNTLYPSDRRLDASLLQERKLVSSQDLEGTSHKRITEEVYTL